LTTPSGSTLAPASTAAVAAHILIVDDEPAYRNLLGVMLTRAGMCCTAVPGGKEALAALEAQPVDALISDLNMPGLSGMELLAEVQRRRPELPFLVITGVDDVRVGVQALQHGADDYLVKPFQADVVLASLQRAFHKKRLERELENYRLHLQEMVAERTQQLQAALRGIERSYQDTLEVLGAVIDLRDSPTAGHSRRVFLYSNEIAKAMGYTEDQLRGLGMGAWLHDIGKLAIPDGILLKPGPLTDEERAVMQRHVIFGFDLIKTMPFLSEAAEIVLAHHENYDGTGYPLGLHGDRIPLSAKIFSVADAVDAMTSDRPYRSAMTFEAARDRVAERAGTQFDPQVARTFLSIPDAIWEPIRTNRGTIQIRSLIAAGRLTPDTVPEA
jgi:response regulator RpfG family c-di-GMP phosphodiesterase